MNGDRAIDIIHAGHVRGIWWPANPLDIRPMRGVDTTEVYQEINSVLSVKGAVLEWTAVKRQAPS